MNLGAWMLFGLFGCGSRAVTYRPDAKAEPTSCAVVEVTGVHLGKPVSPSMVRADSWLEGEVVSQSGVEDAKLRVNFESLTSLKPQVGEFWLVHLNASGNAVRMAVTPAGTTCGES